MASVYVDVALAFGCGRRRARGGYAARVRSSLTSLCFIVLTATALLSSSAARADVEVAPGALPVIVGSSPSPTDRDGRALAALRGRVVEKLIAARPEMVDLAEGEAAVIGRPANGIETLVSTYEGLASHLVAFEASGRGKKLTLTVSVVVVESRKVLSKKTVKPQGADKRTAEKKLVDAVLAALPKKSSAPSVVVPAAPAPAVVEESAAPVDAAPSAIPEASPTAAATPEAPTTVSEGEVEPATVDDEEPIALWPYVTGTLVGALAIVSVTALLSGAGFGVWALLDSNAYVNAPDDDALASSSLLKGNVADALYATSGVFAIGAAVALAVGLTIGLTGEE